MGGCAVYKRLNLERVGGLGLVAILGHELLVELGEIDEHISHVLFTR